MRLLLFIAALLAGLAGPADAQNYVREELRVPMDGTGGKGLETLFIRPAEPGRYPLVIISHGSPRKAEERPGMTPANYYNNALEFARRGFAVAIVMRRGYGDSGSTIADTSGPCQNRDYVRSGRISSEDIRAAIGTLGKRSDIDAARVISVGQSAGGFATVALTANPPPGLVAAISFAGGRGSSADYEICDEKQLVEAFRVFGKTSRVPMLWIYTANDHYFEPKLAAKFLEAFKGGGGRVEFIAAPAWGKDGHGLFSTNGIPQWVPLIEPFLKQHNLAPRAEPAPLPPLPALTAPRELNARGREAFDSYRRSMGRKAFAVSNEGAFGWRAARRSADEAKRDALKFCAGEGDSKRQCRVVFIDDEPAR